MKNNRHIRTTKGVHSMFLQKIWLVFFLVLGFATVRLADADQDAKGHGHKTPHDGLVQEVEGMLVEFLIAKSGEPKVYLFNKGMKSLDRSDLQVKLTAKEHGGAQHERELKFLKDPKEGALFKGEPIKGLTDWDTAVVSIKIKDAWTHVRFSHHH
jgi:hypothetical protein